MSEWNVTTHVNEWTGATQDIWRKTTRTAGGHVVQYQVYENGGRYYWSANCLIMHRPDLSRMAYGTFAVTPYSLSAAKGRATRIGNDVLRAARTPRRLARAA